MTQQPAIQLKASDIANAIYQQEQALQTTYTYLAAVLKELGGHVSAKKEAFIALQEVGEWEVSANSTEEGITFELLEGREVINKRLGRTAGGIIVPNP
jgi:hypothetical protein